MFKWLVSVCVCVSTVNRGHTRTPHHQTVDNIANEDGPRFVDTCKRLQIAFSCIIGVCWKKEEEKITCTGFGPRFSAKKSYTSFVSAILHTKCRMLTVVRRTGTSSFSESNIVLDCRCNRCLCVCVCVCVCMWYGVCGLAIATLLEYYLDDSTQWWPLI